MDKITKLNDDIQNLEKEIKVIKEKNEELELDNRDNRARIKAVKDDHENKNLLMKLLEKNIEMIKINLDQKDKIEAKIKEKEAQIKEESKHDELNCQALSKLAISARKSHSSGFNSKYSKHQNSYSTTDSSKSSTNSSNDDQSITSSANSNTIARHFSKLSTKSKASIAHFYGISLLFFGDAIIWEDLPNNKMPAYEYKKFDWKSSETGTKSNKGKVITKHKFNESDDTKDALNHLQTHISLFMQLLNNSSFESTFKIQDVSSSSCYNQNLIGFNSAGRTDLIISSIYSETIQLINYCNIQLKSVVKFKLEESEEIFTTSDAASELTAQPLAELLSSIPFSECPIMQIITDLVDNFHIMFLSDVGNQLRLHHYSLPGTQAIASIAVWLLYFCPHVTKDKKVDPITKDSTLLKSIQDAHLNIKEKCAKFRSVSQKTELESFVEENYLEDEICLGTEDNESKCLNWKSLNIS